ncbi:ESPR domain-containing protein [Burkholderia vietnamiensis]|uniref:ESPR domain-containing protein n=1 Tax=Burkholderia vietnamiensis TaxID=60552 RepID=A0AAW7T320_BURVI|nr:ESPR domain-containing protein [Burkholderia vietnamiensis]MDN7796537.1 ESPR domain-containing protein [Burkholderia vietnamiensis]
MNKIYKTVWCEATRTWVAVSENAVARAGGTSKSVEPALETKRFFKVTLLGAAALLALGMVGPFVPAAHAASNTGLCLTYKGGTNNVSGTGSVMSNGCNSAGWINGLTPGGSTDWVGLTADDTQVVLDGCHGAALWSQCGVGIRAPLEGRHIGASPRAA